MIETHNLLLICLWNVRVNACLWVLNQVYFLGILIDPQYCRPRLRFTHSNKSQFAQIKINIYIKNT